MEALLSSISAFFIQVCIKALRSGPVPHHVAFIMDDNHVCRYSRRCNKEQLHGHQLGWKALERALEWSLQSGIRVLTIYAFSIENFKRHPDEVKYLFDMIVDKLAILSNQCDIVDQNSIRIRILGEVRLLPLDVQRAAYLAEKRTCHHLGPILNICIPYTSRLEMENAVKTVRQRHQQQQQEQLVGRPISLNQLTKDVQHALQTSTCPPVDILIRTSGEHRLSDFLMWQVCESAVLTFVPESWPEFSFWSFLPSWLDYQLSHLGYDWAPFQSPSQLPWDPSRYDPEILNAVQDCKVPEDSSTSSSECLPPAP